MRQRAQEPSSEQRTQLATRVPHWLRDAMNFVVAAEEDRDLTMIALAEAAITKPVTLSKSAPTMRGSDQEWVQLASVVSKSDHHKLKLSCIKGDVPIMVRVCAGIEQELDLLRPTWRIESAEFRKYEVPQSPVFYVPAKQKRR